MNKLILCNLKAVKRDSVKKISIPLNHKSEPSEDFVFIIAAGDDAFNFRR